MVEPVQLSGNQVTEVDEIKMPQTDGQKRPSPPYRVNHSSLFAFLSQAS
jgi:hypothetical protein